MTASRGTDVPARILAVPLKIRLILAGLGLLVGIGVGLYTLRFVEAFVTFTLHGLHMVVFVAGSGLIGALMFAYVGPLIVFVLLSLGQWMQSRLITIPLSDILMGAAGLVFGLIIANLLSASLSQLPWVGDVLPTIVAVLLAYVGWAVAVNKKPDLAQWSKEIRAGEWFRRDKSGASTDDPDRANRGGVPKILDSSAIIDGRIADVCRTGFLEGPLVIPSFVLEEVQKIADSSDGVKRSRGRRGLDILGVIQKDLDIEVEFYDDNSHQQDQVDTQLVHLAQSLSGKVVTNDYNLNKVASLQGVPVLNINELANAMKPMVIPGEEMDIFLLREGKEPGQGVGYLDDGTMVVVDEGSNHVGNTISVVVTSVLQTAAGRMIFCRPKRGE